MSYVRRGPMRREDARVAYSGPVRAYRPEAVDAETVLNELAHVSATDIGAGGMRLETSSRGVSSDDWIVVVFAFNHVHYRVMAKVVWTSATIDRTVEFAVRFMSLSPPAKAGLRLAIGQSRFRTGGFLDRRRAG